MSAVAPARPALRPAPKTAPARATRPSVKPALRLVAAPRAAASRLPFALLVAAILGSGLVALLMLHTLAAQDGFTVHKLQRQAAGLADLEQQLSVANQQAQAPSTLAARARALGMVPTGDLRILRRRDGRLVAVATAVAVTRPAAKPAATPSPGATPKPAATTTATKPTPARTTKVAKHGRHRPPH